MKISEKERRLILKLLNKEGRTAKDGKYLVTLYDLQYKFRNGGSGDE